LDTGRRAHGWEDVAQELVQRARARRLQLEVEPVVPLETKNWGFRGTEHANVQGRRARLTQCAERCRERACQALGEVSCGILIAAASDQPSHALVRWIVVSPAVS